MSCRRMTAVIAQSMYQSEMFFFQYMSGPPGKLESSNHIFSPNIAEVATQTVTENIIMLLKSA